VSKSSNVGSGTSPVGGGLKSLPPHISGLLAYVSQPSEKANEDLALAYFRKTFGEAFTRQKEAKQADGYVAGSFVLELKGQSKDWLSGLFQGLAYKNLNLDFAQIVVGAKNFLAVWQVSSIPESIRLEISAERGAPNTLGRKFAQRYESRKKELLKLASWEGSDLFAPLFLSRADVVLDKIGGFERTLKEGQRVRQKITLANFTTVLRTMVTFFDPLQPIKTVRAFYSMLYAWKDGSTVQISVKAADQATLGGELITDLVSAKRLQFKDFVESRYIVVEDSHDEFFARYDEALDAVDSSFRRRHGIFFTDLDLSKFVMWLIRQHVPELGHNYLVVDPACGSGNLVTNWRSPLELRHKVVSEIEPELLFAVEQRMKGDAWHNGKFTVVPKVSENRGLNFLDCSADDYLAHLRAALSEKGHAPNKPLAILCNPPYRSDDEQSHGEITYDVHPSILELTGDDAAKERYCCFLAQMKLVCESARDSGLPGESMLLLFTKSAWLTKRGTFEDIRNHMLAEFEDVAGILVNGREFFAVKGSWPVAFTIWRHKGLKANLNPTRSIPLIDLTWLKKEHLASIPWEDSVATDRACSAVFTDEQSPMIHIGEDRTSIREWSGETMVDFKRSRRQAEKGQMLAGGLPIGDHRRDNKKTYGETSGAYVGFMDNLTPCRVKRGNPGKPWFRLNNQFMDIKKNRCFSGPPTHWGYCAEDLVSAQKLFFWYALARTFLQRPYPMWTDADDMWGPSIPPKLEHSVFSQAFAIAFAENECVETYFPANNPVLGTSEVFVSNPMTPLDPNSFWVTVMRPYIGRSASDQVKALLDAVDELFRVWNGLFHVQHEMAVAYREPYFIDERPLTRTAGITQIRDYAIHNDVKSLLSALTAVQTALKATRDEFYRTVTAKSGVNYFGAKPKADASELSVPVKTRFEKILCRRLAVAGLLVDDLHNDPNFGRTKLAKLFYLADAQSDLDLEMDYAREVAGPLDQRALYNPRVGIEALAQKFDFFRSETNGNMVKYRPLEGLAQIDRFSTKHLGPKAAEIRKLAAALRPMSTDQSEIIATLFACWNDFLLQRHLPTDDEIVTEFLHHWHSKKGRFSRGRLKKALAWMREHNIVPAGHGRVTSIKPAAIN
jgi:hypothetical protein